MAEFHLSQETTDNPPWSPLSRCIYWGISLVVRMLTRIHIEGLENIPRQGAFLLAVNHLHLFDAPILFTIMPRRATVFVAKKFRKNLFFRWVLAYGSNVIYVNRNVVDRQALTAALRVLRANGVLALAPEGTRSTTGGLGPGHTGVAYLAVKAPAPILPIVAYGQEQSLSFWKRLRRVPVYIRVGIPIELPTEKASVEKLQLYTEQLMLTLANLLPIEYHGIYAERVQQSLSMSSGCARDQIITR